MAAHHQLRTEPRFSLMSTISARRDRCASKLSPIRLRDENADNEAQSASIQPELFEQDEPRVLPALSQKEQLATLVEALLIEIAAALQRRGRR